MEAMEEHVTQNLGWRDKSLWHLGEERGAEGRGAFDGSLAWPAMLLRESALRHNLRELAELTERSGMAFAPHGKTTMSPELFRRQLEAGAWAITVATPHQALVALRTGVPRVLIAHEVLDVPSLEALREVAADTGGEVMWMVDSAEGVAAAGSGSVLIDVGYPGGRTGVRTRGEALELAWLIEETPGVRLAGVSCYEGMLPGVAEVREFFAEVREVTAMLLDAGHLGKGSLLSAGGSSYFDVVAEELAPWAIERGMLPVLRSGCTITHDDGKYLDTTPFTRIEGSLIPAIELWGQVVSAPEPGLVLVGMGKRDAGADDRLPIPKLLRRAGETQTVPLRPATATATGSDPDLDPDPEAVTCDRMDDQHAYLRVPASLEIRPGDLVGFGVSHPCTTFDKWRTIPIVDDADRIVDIARTYF